MYKVCLCFWSNSRGPGEADSTWIISQGDVDEGSVIFIHLSLPDRRLLTLLHLLSGFRLSLIRVRGVQNVPLLLSSSLSLSLSLSSLTLAHACCMNHSRQLVLLSYLTGGSGYGVVMATGEPKQKTGHTARKNCQGSKFESEEEGAIKGAFAAVCRRSQSHINLRGKNVCFCCPVHPSASTCCTESTGSIRGDCFSSFWSKIKRFKGLKSGCSSSSSVLPPGGQSSVLRPRAETSV